MPEPSSGSSTLLEMVIAIGIFAMVTIMLLSFARSTIERPCEDNGTSQATCMNDSGIDASSNADENPMWLRWKTHRDF